jgi:ribosomal 50S subunit-recycling heat shock protein
MNSVADINDNYRYARALVGERLLALVIEDMSGDNIDMAYGEEGRKHKITLNRPAVDPMTGLRYRENDVTRIELKVTLSDVPSTSAYREQQLAQISEVLKSMPPALQAGLVPYYLEATDLPKRREMADLVRKQLGQPVGPDDQDPEKMALMQQLQQMQQMIEAGKAAYEGQIAELSRQLKDKSAELEIKETEAEAETKLRAAQAEKLKAETQAMRVDILQRTSAMIDPPPVSTTP